MNVQCNCGPRSVAKEMRALKMRSIVASHQKLTTTNWEPSLKLILFSSAQLLSRVRLFVAPWIAACQAFLSNTNSQSSLRFMSIESVMPSSHLILCRPFSSCRQSLPASIFSNESALRMRWPKYWSFSFSIIPSKEIPGLISFRMDWLDLFVAQGTLKVSSNTTVQKH